MNLRGEAAVKELAGVGDGLILAAVLNTNEESITYENGVLTLPGYSIAVFTLG